jgi:hypothetical protein
MTLDFIEIFDVCEAHDHPERPQGALIALPDRGERVTICGMSAERFRWRTAMRRRLPWFLIDLGVADKGKTDCGRHEWYRHDTDTEHCYHCVVGIRPILPGRTG